MQEHLANIDKEFDKEFAAKKSLRERWQSPRFRAMVVGGAVALVVAVAVTVWVSAGSVTTDDAQVDGHIVPVAAKVYGNVAEVLVNDNQFVRAGEVIARLDARDYEAKVAQARAALALAEAQAKAAATGVPLTEATTASGASGAAAQVAMAQADATRAQLAYEQVSGHELAASRAGVEARQAANDKAQADLARMKPLAAKAEISKQQFDAYEAAARVAESELTAAREKLAAVAKQAEQTKASAAAAQAQVQAARAQLAAASAGRKQVDIRAAEASSASAAVEAARANLQAAELQLSYTEIKAPVDGVVTKKSLQVGQVVQPSQSLLMIVPREVWITANFKETQLAKVRAGQTAEVEVDMYGETFKGRVDSIAHATGARLSLLPPENATGNYVKVVQRIPVKIVLDNHQATLRPGMNVVTTIRTR